MKKLLLLSLISVGSLLSGCASTSTYHHVPRQTKVIIIHDEVPFYPIYTSWRIGYDWGFGPRYMGHGHWHRRR